MTKAIRLFDKITYAPLADSRSVDLSRGDVQCPALSPHDGGYLHCTYKKGHSGNHHTAYAETDGVKENLKWE